jgi:cytochrome bd ubiquinol oxidase subunit II
MSLPTLWSIIIAVFWTGFFVLEGFDFGVGVLHRLVGRSDVERRVAINTIGPYWDGNEVWLVVGAAAIFAAFPSWYATWFSAAYLALLLLIAALIMRGVSFEFRGKVDSDRWRRTWSGTLTIGSALAPFLIGVALGDLLAGLPVGSDQEFTGSFWSLLTPYGLWTGVTLLMLCLLHGATFLGLKTTAQVRDRAHLIARRLAWVAAAVVVAYVGWTFVLSDNRGVLAVVLLALAVVAVIVAAVTVGRGRDGRAFATTSVAIAATVAGFFASLYPNVLVSSTDSAYNLTVGNTAAGSYALTVMTVVAAIFFPLVLAYQIWGYVVFRRRVSAPPLSPEPTARRA